MGEQADLIINGDVCQGCGEDFLEDGPGYPRSCRSCGGNESRLKGGNPRKKENMDESERLFNAAGLHYEVFNNGFHWKVSGLDFYPSTHRWMDLKNDFRGSGIKEFIRYVQSRQKASSKTPKILTVEQIFDIAKTSKDKSLFGICETIHRGIYP